MSNKSNGSSSEEAQQPLVKVKIDWESDEGKDAKFANHIMVSSDGATYFLRFYQVLPPAINYNDPEAVQSIASVKGQHVVTLSISADSIPAIVKVLQEAIE